MEADETATVQTLCAYRSVMRQVIERHYGEVVNAPGDALLAKFPSAAGAVGAAIEMQRNLEGRNMELAPERRMDFRVGVNLSDVIEQDDGAIYGDGVNIAARLEALADGGGVCVSGSVFDAVDGKLDLGFDFVGDQQVKNLTKPVRVYRVRTGKRVQVNSTKTGRHRKWWWPGILILMLCGASTADGLGPNNLLPTTTLPGFNPRDARGCFACSVAVAAAVGRPDSPGPSRG
jgi:class 3 adenylate cyclase